MKKITLIALHLGYGGIERCIVSLANALVKKYDVRIVSIYKLYDEPSFKINKKVKITYLLETDLALRVSDYKNMFFNLKWLSLVKRLNQDYLKKRKFLTLIKDGYYGIKLMMKDRNTALKNFLLKDASDVYISTRILTNNIVGLYGNAASLKIAWEHNHYHRNMKYAHDVIKSVEHMDILVLVSKELNKFYKENCKCNTIYIPNTIDNIPKRLSKLNNKKLISVGRLSPEKGYMDLLRVFKLLNNYDNEYTLDIVGDGEEYEKMKLYIKENKLKDKVTLHGFQNRDYIDKLENQASLYLMTSHTESFGIVLLEAMSHGLPCIAFSSAEGAREIIQNNKNGYLIDYRSKVIMAKKIDKVINDKELLQKLGKNARKSIEEYKMDKVINNWIKIIEKK